MLYRNTLRLFPLSIIFLSAFVSCKDQQPKIGVLATGKRDIQVEGKKFSDSVDRSVNIVPIVFSGKYPEIIDSLHLQEAYEDIRSRIFYFNYLDTCDFVRPFPEEKVPFNTLDLKYEGYQLKEDTISLFFGFYYRDTIRCDSRWPCGNVAVPHGAAYEISKRKLLYYIDEGSIWTIEPKDSKLKRNIRFIKNNQLPTNSWLDRKLVEWCL